MFRSKAKSKAQVAMEYIMVVGFVVVLTIPLILIYYNYTNKTNDAIIANQAEQIIRKVVDASEAVYFLGEPSQTILKVYVPNYIKSATLTEKEIYYKIDTGTQQFDVAQVSSVNISGALPTTPGIHLITIRATDEGVQVSHK